MSKRTSPVVVLARFWAVAFFFALFPYGLVAVLGGAISLGFLALIALVVTLLFNGLQWLGHRALFGHTEEYQQFRESGGDPWFHMSCPPPFNCDSEQVRLTGSDEPEIRWYCNNCGVEAVDLDAPCRACGFEQYECGRCGSPVRDAIAVCPRCGNDPLASQGSGVFSRRP